MGKSNHAMMASTMKPCMKPVHLLLVVAAVGMQAATDEAYLDSMFDDPSHDIGASAGRRGGPGSLTTSGSFMMAANRAGNDEEEFGEADADVGGRRRKADAVSIKTLRTPVMLASCKTSWPFQLEGTDETIHACVECKPDAPLPFAIAKHGKRLIWACDATKFKEKALCEKSLKWLNPPKGSGGSSETGQSTEITCRTLVNLIANHDNAAKVYSEHSQDLKLSTTAKLASVSLVDSSQNSYNCLTTRCAASPNKYTHDQVTVLGKTRMQVEKTISVAQMKGKTGGAQVFTVLSHTVRACGYIPEQPLQCLDIKQSQCIWSIVKSEEDLTQKNFGAWFHKFKSGQNLPGKVSSKKEEQDQHCGPDVFLHLTTSRKI